LVNTQHKWRCSLLLTTLKTGDCRATDGNPTFNTGIILSDGAMLHVTMAYEADRTGHVYSASPSAPDHDVATDWTQLGTSNDPVVSAAVCRLHAQPASQSH
jgi:hypothetical protein